MEEEAFAVAAEDSTDAVGSPVAAATVAVTGAVDEATPLTRSKDVILQARHLPRVTVWAMIL